MISGRVRLMVREIFMSFRVLGNWKVLQAAWVLALVMMLLVSSWFPWTPLASAGERLFPDEAMLLAMIEKEPSPCLYAELAEVRGRHAASCYGRWLESGQISDLQKAIYYAASAAELRPDWDQPRVLLAMIYAEFSGDRETLEMATELLIEAVDINPANGPAQLMLAQILMKQGRFWSAIEQYDSLFVKSPAMITPVNTAPLALCYILDGRIQAGILHFDRLAAEHPDHPAVAVGQAVLLRHGDQVERARNILTGLASSTAAGPELRRYAGDLLAAWDREEME
ncbi:hypothetical protein LZ24_02825 [Desulfobotulus alkaliphilus]|uniref:Uncharacterized protein n=2 Tax=Desulfobotulus alkaliphilus TaxID=622671 RepID=A0A562REU3_9BACT|nr:hypothetical protein LZ24_02825 [Desulfobotulus alkaliphilus]